MPETGRPELSTRGVGAVAVQMNAWFERGTIRWHARQEGSGPAYAKGDRRAHAGGEGVLGASQKALKAL